MSGTKQRTEITIETHQLMIIRIHKSKNEAVFCENCRENVPVFSPANAALIFRTGTEFLEALLQTGQIHLARENTLCGNSLAGYFQKEVRYLED